MTVDKFETIGKKQKKKPANGAQSGAGGKVVLINPSWYARRSRASCDSRFFSSGTASQRAVVIRNIERERPEPSERGGLSSSSSQFDFAGRVWLRRTARGSALQHRHFSPNPETRLEPIPRRFERAETIKRPFISSLSLRPSPGPAARFGF